MSLLETISLFIMPLAGLIIAGAALYLTRADRRTQRKN